MQGVPAFVSMTRGRATALELAAGVDDKTISKRQGLANVRFTLSTYRHVMNAIAKQAADPVGRMMERKAVAM